MKPWQFRGWFLDRAKEMLYQSMSWGYATAIALTVFFIAKPDSITRDAMIASWALAFGNRIGHKIAEARNGQPPGPQTVVSAPGSTVVAGPGTTVRQEGGSP